MLSREELIHALVLVAREEARIAYRKGIRPKEGELCVEMTRSRYDTSMVGFFRGYDHSDVDGKVWVVEDLNGEIHRWANASFAPVKCRLFPPTKEQIHAE